VANKRPLVLFSGGLDSTFNMLLHTLEGESVDYVYIDGGQGKSKVESEQATIDRILTALHEHARRKEKDVWHRFGGHPLSKVNFCNTPSAGWRQPIPWLVSALEVVDPEKHSAVEVSYVQGDEIISRIPELQAAWAAMWSITKVGELVPLKFPLKDVSKQGILCQMPEDLYKLTWVCETPSLQTFAWPKTCLDLERSHNGRCRACETRLVELYRFELRNGKTLEEYHAECAERRAREEAEEVARARRRQELVGEDMAEGYKSALPAGDELSSTFDRLPNRGDWKEPNVLAVTNADGEPGGFYVTDATTMDQLMTYAHSDEFTTLEDPSQVVQEVEMQEA
jgi:7-cyano-7-deazaguanine synthase in queuosine biosynthesis